MHSNKQQSYILVFLLSIIAVPLLSQDSVRVQTPNKDISDSYFQYSNLMGFGAGGNFLISENLAIEGSIGFNPFIYVALGPPFPGNIINADIQLRLQTYNDKYSFYVASGIFLGTYEVINIVAIAAPKISIGIEGLTKSKIGLEVGSTINLKTEISGSSTKNGSTIQEVHTRDKFAGSLFPYFKIKVTM